MHANNSYSPPVITDFQDAHALDDPSAIRDFDTRGNQTIIILGRNFGPQPSLSVYTAPISAYSVFGDGFARFYASDCAVILAHQQVQCTTPEGFGARLKWIVTVDKQASVQSTTSYGPPVVHSIVGDGWDLADTLGGELFVIKGKNFGPCRNCSLAAAQAALTSDDPTNWENRLEGVTYGPWGQRYDATGSCYVSVPHVEIRCLTTPGMGKNLTFIVTVGGQMSEDAVVSGPFLMYKPPKVNGISPMGTTYGRYTVSLRGSNLNPAARIMFGGVQVSVTGSDRQAASFLVFACPPSQGVDIEVVVIHDTGRTESNQESEAVLFTYQAPHIERLVVESIDSFTSKLTIFGFSELDVTDPFSGGSFGLVPSLAADNKVLVFPPTDENNPILDGDGTECVILDNFEGDTLYNKDEPMWDHNRIVCQVGMVKGTVVVRVGPQQSNVKVYLDWSPVVQNVTLPPVEERNTQGNWSMTLYGEFLGSDPEMLEVLLLDRLFSNVWDDGSEIMLWDHAAIDCAYGSGVGWGGVG
jgi:hypothetical protein